MRTARRQVEWGLAVLAGALISLLTVLVGVNLVLRNLGLGGFPWLHEIAEYSLYAMTYLAAPWVLSQGAHVAVDLVVGAVPSGWRRHMKRLANGLGAVATFLILVYGLRAAFDAHANESYKLQELKVAEWWLLSIIPVSAALMLLEFLARLFGGHDDGAGPADVGKRAGL